MTEKAYSQQPTQATSLAWKDLKSLAAEISEVLFDWDETSTMERKIADGLLNKVSRVLNRCEARPSQIRDAEEVLMHIDDPELGIALLRQVFLVKSEATEQMVLTQLIRLAESPSQKTSELTVEALKESAYSETPRLQNIGCQALFQSRVLSEEELREFVRSEKIGFEHRLNAVRYLVERCSILAHVALIESLEQWAKLPGDQRRANYRPLIEVARCFDRLQGQGSEVLDTIVADLFDVADGHRFEVAQKKVVQNALAELSDHTVPYLRERFPKTSIATIYTLGACARVDSTAISELMRRAHAVIRSAPGDRSRLLRETAYQLQGVDLRGDQELQNDLEDLLNAVNSESSLSDHRGLIAEYRSVKDSWRGKTRKTFFPFLKDCANEFELNYEVDESDLWQLRHAFRSDRKDFPARNLTATERTVLIQALYDTHERLPLNWRSARWLIREYETFEGHERLSILEMLGQAALDEKGSVKTNRFRRFLDFFEEQVQNGSPAESDAASEWVDKLAGERLPGATDCDSD